MTVFELYQRAQAFDLMQTAKDAVLANETEILDANRDQMLHGLKPNGDVIGYYRGTSYALEKNRMNPLPGYGIVDLRYSGDMFRFLSIDPKSTIISSSVPYFDDLEDRYGAGADGNDFLGLSEQGINDVMPNFIKTLTDLTYAGLFK